VSNLARLTSTSYVILGLLCTRSWSAYDLTQQMERGWSDIWPRASRGIYNEPKKLQAHGYATSRTERNGRRTRTVYEATDLGRTAFRGWLTAPPQPPTFESEALIRVLFADHGSLEHLRDAIASIREHARARSVALLAQGTEYQRSGGPFPERLHLLHLVGGFLGEQYAAMSRWADWAEEEIETWHGGVDASAVSDLDELGRHVAALFEPNVSQNGATGEQ
jgi:PadR family transcriptional regulator, regulatory protein AphA